MSDNQSSITPSASTPALGARYREAFNAAFEEIAAIKESDVLVINLDIPPTVATVVGALPEILALRAELQEHAPRFDITQLDRLERYAFALFHAHMLAQAAAEPPEILVALGEEATKLRQQLVSDVNALVFHGLIPAEALASLKGPPGYLNLASDLYLLAGVVRANWDKVMGKTVIAEATLARAEELSERLVAGVGLREQGTAAVAASGAHRQRAFTLLVKTYDQVRRAVSFLRWNDGDVESIAPSLYAGRAARRKTSEPSPTPTTDVAQAAPTNGASSVVIAPPAALGAAPSGTAVNAQSPAAAVAVGIPAGLPGGTPFVRS
jgi:hypothetical protein